MRNRGQPFCKQKISPDDFKSIATSSFYNNVGWKMVAMISLKMKNLEFEILFESGFSEDNIA